MWSDDAERTDLDVISDLRFIIDDRVRADLGLLSAEEPELEQVTEPRAPGLGQRPWRGRLHAGGRGHIGFGLLLDGVFLH
jgi:hypothetical protein